MSIMQRLNKTMCIQQDQDKVHTLHDLSEFKIQV